MTIRDPRKGPLDPYRFGPQRTLTRDQAAEQAGVSPLTAERFWRALGLPEVEQDSVAFNEDDVQALRTLRAIADTGISTDELLSIARVYGQALGRIADAETRLFQENFVEPLAARGLADRDIEDHLVPIVEHFLDHLARQLDYVHRQHLIMAIQQLTVDGTSRTDRLAVGFADLAGYSSLSRRLPLEDVERVIERFEEITTLCCSDPAVRMVKTLGDAVMFVSAEPLALLEAARAMVRAVDADGVLDAARAGLDVGEVAARGGDYFGAPVNRAARITGFAKPGTVVVSEEMLEAIGGSPQDASRIGSKRLKGVGKLRLYKVL